MLSALLSAVGLFWIGRAFRVDGKLRFGNPPLSLPSEGGLALDAEPRQVRAEITRVQGDPGVRPGDHCEFLIERRARQGESAYCNAQVVCGDRLLYGGPDRGYFACKVYDDDDHAVVGSDPNTTSGDHDAAIHLNTRQGIMRIWDDEHGPRGQFLLEAEILSVQ